jgi:hypothetical protein
MMNLVLDAAELTVVCAWCDSVLQAGGPRLSHGLCTGCADRLLRDARDGAAFFKRPPRALSAEREVIGRMMQIL